MSHNSAGVSGLGVGVEVYHCQKTSGFFLSLDFSFLFFLYAGGLRCWLKAGGGKESRAFREVVVMWDLKIPIVAGIFASSSDLAFFFFF